MNVRRKNVCECYETGNWIPLNSNRLLLELAIRPLTMLSPVFVFSIFFSVYCVNACVFDSMSHGNSKLSADRKFIAYANLSAFVNWSDLAGIFTYILHQIARILCGSSLSQCVSFILCAHFFLFANCTLMMPDNTNILWLLFLIIFYVPFFLHSLNCKCLSSRDLNCVQEMCHAYFGIHSFED